MLKKLRMIRVGITGQAGFMGTHLFNYLRLKNDEINLVPFNDDFFDNPITLENFVSQCDAIVHLAAMNRHGDPQVIYNTNILLVKKLINALERTQSKAHILFSSSTQEERDNLYGKSKRDGRTLLTNWANKNKGTLTGLIIPNVYGPFGKPFYNSVIATFCHQLTHNEHPHIEIDGQLKLIYISELVKVFYQSIISCENNNKKHVLPTSECKVSEILNILVRFKIEYFEKGIFPSLNTQFELNLFNTFRCYIDIVNINPVKLKVSTDERGSFVETIKLNLGGQVSFSTTKPGITRGNHYHTRKIERFAVIKGEAVIQLRRIGTDQVHNISLTGNQPSYVDIPVWYTHNITNVGTDDLYTIFWINEFFDTDDPDTYFEKV